LDVWQVLIGVAELTCHHQGNVVDVLDQRDSTVEAALV